MSNLLKLPKRKMKISTEKNQVICGDCLDWLKYVPDNSIDLCYIDPPFFSNKNYEVVWGNGYELRSFGDRWKGGIKHYISWMEDRVKEIHRVLKPTGSIFLHCDWHASHRLRVMLDDIFGDEHFRNEIIWHYRRWTANSDRFQALHDTIFYYSKGSKEFVFNPEYTQGKDVRFWKTNTVKKNNKKINQIIIYDKRETEKAFREGRIKLKKNEFDNIVYKEPNKVLLGDTWEIDRLGPTAKERIGYKTQKPEALLERIIKCASNKGDVVLDPFGGGGTTSAVAAKLGRKFITGDVSPVAIRVIAKRLNDINANFEIRNVPKTKKEWLEMDGHEFADRICEFMGWSPNPKKSNDKGIDAHAPNEVPIQIKNKKSKVGRPEVQKFVGALSSFEKGLFVAWEFAPTAYEYVQEVKRDFGKEVEFIEVGEILSDILIDDKKKEQIEELLHERVKSA